MCDCVLCFSSIEKQSDRNLVRGRGKFNVYEEIISLQFTVHDTIHHICKQCLGKLQRRRGLRTRHTERRFTRFYVLFEQQYKNYQELLFQHGLNLYIMPIQQLLVSGFRLLKWLYNLNASQTVIGVCYCNSFVTYSVRCG